jgi:RNA polymerase sigma factor (sigma-70 family)
MAGTTWAVLRGLLADRYEDLKSRLTRQLGSEELASESLHEAWLRLHRTDDLNEIRNPRAYLLRIAFNIARDRLRADNRLARPSDVAAVLEVEDQAPGPAQEVEARLEFEALQRAIQDLPERTRAILLASRLDAMTHQAIAERFGISRRTVLYELERAVVLLEARMERKAPEHCASKPPESSL